MQLGLDPIMVLGEGRRACSGSGGSRLPHRLPFPTPLSSRGVGRLALTRRRHGSSSHGGSSGCCQHGEEGWRPATTAAAVTAAAAAAVAGAGGSDLMMEGRGRSPPQKVMRPPSCTGSSHRATGLAERRQGQRRGHDAVVVLLDLRIVFCVNA